MDTTHFNRAHERRTRPENEETWRIRAQERVRHALRAGKLTKPDLCPKCQRPGQVVSYSSDLQRAVETVEFMCNRCLREIRPRAHGKQPPRFQNIRKLPPYEELKKHVLSESDGGEGLTYGEVAEMYGASKTVVARTLKDRAVRAGEWPLPINQHEKLIKVMAQKSRRPPYHELKRLCEDRPYGAGWTYEEAAKKYGVTRGQVHDWLKAMAVERGEWPLRITKLTKYKRAVALANEAGESHTVMAVGIHGLLEDFCDEHELTLAQWAEQYGAQYGLTGKYLYAVRAKLRNDPKTRVYKTTAVKVLLALGEEVPPSLREYLKRVA